MNIDIEQIRQDIATGKEPILPHQSFHEQTVIYNARSACVRHAERLLALILEGVDKND